MCTVDWGLVVSALAAIGSIGAALAALYIATRDRKERARERLAANEAEAKLIFAGMTASYPPNASLRGKVEDRYGEKVEACRSDHRGSDRPRSGSGDSQSVAFHLCFSV